MRLNFSFRRLSLRAKLISDYLVILGIGGLATSLLGSWIVSSTIMMQPHRAVDHDLAVARSLYDQKLETVEQTVQLVAPGTIIQQHLQQHLAAGKGSSLSAYLDSIRKDNRLDFLTLTDPKGHVSPQVSEPHGAISDISSIGVVRAALSGKVAAATEILSAEILHNTDPLLASRAYLPSGESPRTDAPAPDKTAGPSGLVMIASAPVVGTDGRIVGALYGGILLNQNFEIVDRIWKVLFQGDRLDNQDIGVVTIFQDDMRVSTTVKTTGSVRWVGTPSPAEVREDVLEQGRSFRGRMLAAGDWYVSAYAPLRNYEGRIIGMLAVGRLERAYTSTRNRVILSFFGIATIGFILILGVTYREIGKVMLPVGKMVAATQNIAAGRFDQEVQSSPQQGEIALLADSFNTMLKSLRQMRGDLEEWGRTLEEKVKQRSEELFAMQARVAQSERLASLGILAAGVAHEINNPLGAIMALTGLTLEELKENDPNRENLQEVVRQSERCRDIVKGLLQFSRHSKVNPELADLNKILQDTLSLVTKQAQFLNITVATNYDPQLPPVMANKSELEEVFMNILINAVQAMQERGTITITTRHSAPDNSVEVLITDTGCGVPPDKIDQLFHPFFTTKESGQGTGLGLSIAYGIITSHHGSISVESEVGKGSTFKIRLPIASAVATGRLS
jgi:two-component system NtrC family sensor kinase